MHVDCLPVHFVKRVILLFTDSQPVFNPHGGKDVECELSEKIY